MLAQMLHQHCFLDCNSNGKHRDHTNDGCHGKPSCRGKLQAEEL